MATKSEIARHLRVDPASINRWAKRGMPVYDLELAVAWHGTYIRTRRGRKAAAAPAVDPAGDPAARTWRERLDKAAAQRAELALARERGEFFPKADVLSTWQRRFSDVRARLLAIPNKVGGRTSAKALRDEVLLAVEEEIYEALMDVSGTRGDGDE